MCKKAFILPGSSVLFGAVGFVLRRMELKAVLEPATGLALSGRPITTVLIALSVLFALLCILYLLAQKDLSSPDSFRTAFSCSRPTAFVFYSASALLMLAGGLSLAASGRSKLATAAALVAVIAAVCLFMSELSVFRSDDKYQYLSTAAVVFFCILLVVIYRENSANPVLLTFAYKILALVCAVLCSYYCAGYAFGHRFPRRAMAFCSLSFYFSAVSLADKPPLYLLLFLLSSLVFSLTNLVLLSLNSRSGTRS